jgi:hypothetical protein
VRRPQLAAAEATTELVRRGLGHDARPGLVVSIATAGDLVQWHPHVHLLATDGGKAADSSWQPLPEWDAPLLTRLFRESLLAKLVLAHAISPELVQRLLAGWSLGGLHVGGDQPGNTQALQKANEADDGLLLGCHGSTSSRRGHARRTRSSP